MAIVKHISIHTQPLSFFKYILNRDKNSDMKYATGINVSANEEEAYKCFKQNFEKFSGERFFKKSLLEKNENDIGKESVRVHHYIQSFKPGEVSPEEAHKIGIEWAKKVFGEDRQIVVSTHLDRGHIHNHIAVAPYDMNGKKWNDNTTTLNKCRKISDELCKAHGLTPLKNAKRGTGRSWGEYLTWKNGTSWKKRTADLIDELIADKDVNSVEDLIRKMEERGYQIKYGKHITFKTVPGVKLDKGLRSHRLGDGYQADEIAYRIAHKEEHISDEMLENYTGVQLQYALYLRELHLMVFRKQENTAMANYSDLVRNAELLNYIVGHNIKSKEQLKELVNKSDEKLKNANDRKKALMERYKVVSMVIDDSVPYLQLIKRKLSIDEMDELKKYEHMQNFGIYSDEDVQPYIKEKQKLQEEILQIDEDIEKAKRDRSEISKIYNTYISQIETDEYKTAFEKYRARQSEESEYHYDYDSEKTQDETEKTERDNTIL